MVPLRSNRLSLLRGPIVACLVSAALVSAGERSSADVVPSAVAIDQLLKDLHDDDNDVREESSEAILALGEAAVEPLKRLERSTASREVANRAHILLKTIDYRKRWAHAQGGEAVCGVQATLVSLQDEFIAGRDLRFEVEIKNVGSEPVDIQRIQNWTTRFHNFWDYQPSAQAAAIVNNLSRAEDETTAGMKTKVYEREFPSRSFQVPETLAPGAALRFEYRVASKYLSEGDEYEARVIYYSADRSLIKGATKDLESNRLKFKVGGDPAKLGKQPAPSKGQSTGASEANDREVPKESEGPKVPASP